MAGPLRVGRISALNMYPVYHGLERLWTDAGIASLRSANPRSGPGIVFTDGLPAALNAALLDGRLDLSAVSSIAFARNADRLRLIPAASISAEGAVDSIQLFSRVPFEQVRTVAVTPHSATSVTLLRVLAPDAAPFELLAEPPDAALERVDGVLLIADEALTGLLSPFAPHHTDLAEVWRARTGLPMVFAVWAAREEAAARMPEGLATMAAGLRRARERYAADPEAVVAAAAERFPFPADFIRGYFRRLRYGFGPAERAGLERFLELASAAGELAAVPRLAA